MKEIRIEDLYGARVVGLKRVYYVGDEPGEESFDMDPATCWYYQLCLIKDGDKYIIELETWFGWCGSGYTTASSGRMSVSRVYDFGPLTHVPVDKNLKLEPREASELLYGTADIVTNVFEYSDDGGDGYYPMGGVCIEPNLFEEIPRAMHFRPVYVFFGDSALGKSTLAGILGANTTNYEGSVYETDSSETLPEIIYADYIVVGNKYHFDLEDIKARVFDTDNVIFVGFSKEV